MRTKQRDEHRWADRTGREPHRQIRVSVTHRRSCKRTGGAKVQRPRWKDQT